jgi:hypothetical protein
MLIWLKRPLYFELHSFALLFSVIFGSLISNGNDPEFILILFSYNRSKSKNIKEWFVDPIRQACYVA